MSFMLQKTIPNGYEVKVFDNDIMREIVCFGPLQMPMQEFCDAVLYTLIASDLAENDPRAELVAQIKTMQKIKGDNINKERLRHAK